MARYIVFTQHVIRNAKFISAHGSPSEARKVADEHAILDDVRVFDAQGEKWVYQTGASPWRDDWWNDAMRDFGMRGLPLNELGGYSCCGNLPQYAHHHWCENYP